MKTLFQCLPKDFFKPLTGKYQESYADCIQLLFNTFKPEISYGVNREIVVATLEDYFSEDEGEMFSEDGEETIRDARGKANFFIRTLKECGWLEYESGENHQIQVLLLEHAIPVIESFNRIIREEEAEYQGIISQIYSTLLNKDLYHKPYELILKGVQENTDRLLSELKKLNVSIKRHMDKQTNEMDASEILEHFFEYHKNIGSKAYLRMKTSENIYYFRSEIIDKLEDILSSQSLMDLATNGYMEVEQILDRDLAYDALLQLILDAKSAFFRLDDIIREIDQKHTRYMKNAVMRAKFLMSTGNNLEGRLLQILNLLAEELNEEVQASVYDDIAPEAATLFHLYPQRYLSPESLKTIPVTKVQGVVNELSDGLVMTEEERALYKEALREKNRNRFTRKNINTYVEGLLVEQSRIKASLLPIETKRDLIRLIYISLYGNHKANGYGIERSTDRIRVGEYEIPDFVIVRND